VAAALQVQKRPAFVVRASQLKVHVGQNHFPLE
jgi:hypothetical protein